jgi:hypothetical protein
MAHFAMDVKELHAVVDVLSHSVGIYRTLDMQVHILLFSLTFLPKHTM